jgi:N-acetylmuramoyl-L-alanine amidase
MSLERVWIPSPNYSSRGGGAVRLIVLHTAEGARTFQDLGRFFQGNVQASSHCGADDTPNTVGEFVKRANKAWHVAQYNSVAVGLEQCAFAAWSRDEWMSHPHLLANTAQWIAEEAAKFAIPIVKLNALQAQGAGRGVCQHRDLGVAGGGHHDCGDGFPIDYVLELARGGGAPTPSPTPQLEAVDMIASAVSDGGTLHVFWVAPDKRTVHYRFQGSAQTDWTDGGVFTTTGKDLAGISASRSKAGNLEVFAVFADGDVAHTWQQANSTAWHGGQEGKQVAGFTQLPGG